MRGGQNYFYLFYMRCLCLAPDKQLESEQTFFRTNSTHYQALYCTQEAESKPLKRRATVFIKNNERERVEKKTPPRRLSVTPSEAPLGHLTCKGNEYFVDWFVPSHTEPSSLKSTLVTLDLSCMEVRALGPAEVD